MSTPFEVDIRLVHLQECSTIDGILIDDGEAIINGGNIVITKLTASGTIAKNVYIFNKEKDLNVMIKGKYCLQQYKEFSRARIFLRMQLLPEVA